jgi:hypothetical protein
MPVTVGQHVSHECEIDAFVDSVSDPRHGYGGQEGCVRGGDRYEAKADALNDGVALTRRSWNFLRCRLMDATVIVEADARRVR